ncbi:MAG: hypothetical protein WCB44_12620 [Stellaceae bacterium]
MVLSSEEIVHFLQAVPGLRNRAALTIAYGAGLLVSDRPAMAVILPDIVCLLGQKLMESS